MRSPSAPDEKSGNTAGFGEPWVVRVYIAGWTPASQVAVRNVRHLESEYLPPGSTVEVVDLLTDPEAARRDHILAIPTVVRVFPKPLRRIVGDFSDLDKALKVLGFRQTPA